MDPHALLGAAFEGDLGKVSAALKSGTNPDAADTGGVDPATQIAAPTSPVNWGPNAADRAGGDAGERFDWADIYWTEYLYVDVGTDNYVADKRQIVFCPSGRRELADTRWAFYNIRRTRMDYCLDGLTVYNGASNANRAGHTLVRLTNFWEPKDDTWGDATWCSFAPRCHGTPT